MFDWLFGCSHPRTSWPQHGRVVCLDCGKEFAYDWQTMQRGEQLERWRYRAAVEVQPIPEPTDPGVKELEKLYQGADHRRAARK